LMFYTDSTALVDPEQRKTIITPILDSLFKNEHKFEAIGVHGHSSAARIPMESHEERFNEYYEKYGALSSITEFNVNSGNENYDANFARDTLIICLANEHFNAFNLWGFKSSKTSSKCFMDANYNLKPAGKALIDVIYNKCYTHDAKAVTNEDGAATVRGFYGNYDVTVEANGKVKKAMVAFHKGYENVLEINIDDDKFNPVEEKEDKNPIVSENKDTNLPDGGEVILSHDDFLERVTGNTLTKYLSKDDAGLVTVKINEKPEKDTAVHLTFGSDYIGNKIKPGDVCMLTFKARLMSGGEEGVGYIKPYVQASKEKGYKKALFARTTFGTEWTTCYLPFVGIDGLTGAGVRFGGMAQTLEMKDFSLINYGTKVDLSVLPSTIME